MIGSAKWGFYMHNKYLVQLAFLEKVCHVFSYVSVDILSGKMSNSKPNVIFVLGGPGAGKGTQCSK